METAGQEQIIFEFFVWKGGQQYTHSLPKISTLFIKLVARKYGEPNIHSFVTWFFGRGKCECGNSKKEP